MRKLAESFEMKLENDEKALLNTAVQNLLANCDVGPLVSLLQSCSLLPKKNHEDVIHSLESTFETRFQSLLLAGLPNVERRRVINEFCFNDHNPLQGQADTFIMQSTMNSQDLQAPILLFELKNTPISSLDDSPDKWHAQVTMSKWLLNMEDEWIANLQLTPTWHNDFNSVQDQWDAAVEQLKKNAVKIKTRFPGRPIVGFVLYRIGLHRILFESYNNM